MNERHLDSAISNHFNHYKQALILLGARQVGKTTILQKIFPKSEYLSVDTESIRQTLNKFDPTIYRQIINSSSLYVIIDEAHLLSDPGRTVKIIYDQLPQHKLIVTGSSAFYIKNKTSESMAGRKIEYHLYPLTLSEYLVQMGVEEHLSYSIFEKIVSGRLKGPIIRPYDARAILDNLLIFGSYPELLSVQRDTKYLTNLVDSVVFTDLSELSLLENKKAAISLLRLLAHQIGSQVNYAELASNLEISAITVKRYIELFEQSFIIFTLLPYSTSQRDEIGKAPKVYFYDLGLRNALIGNFSTLQNRNDKGALFENFVITELSKYNAYGDFGYHFNYWRTTAGSEVDLVLSRPGELLAIEIKSTSRRVNRSFLTRYPGSKLSVITRDNYWV